jgi:hypothetical protein
VQARWPTSARDCPRCPDPIILDGSSQTSKGWKVSYHLLYPLLCSKTKFLHLAIFPSCRSRWRIEQGTAAVYSRNQLFRLPLNFKLPDETSTPLRLPGSCAVSDFRNACVTCGTCLDNEAWRMPDGDDSRNTRPDYISARSDLLVPRRHYPSRSTIRRGPSGSLYVPSCYKPGSQRGDCNCSAMDKRSFRWDAQPRAQPVLSGAGLAPSQPATPFQWFFRDARFVQCRISQMTTL